MSQSIEGSANFMLDKKVVMLLCTTIAEVDSTRTFLTSRTHFVVLSLGLEVQGQGLQDLENSLSSARGQHYSWIG